MSWTGFGGSRRPRTVAHVAEFLVEMYVSRTDAGAVERGTGRTRVSATRLSAEGTPVRYLRSLFVPNNETCFLLYEAASAETRWLDVVHRSRLALGGALRHLRTIHGAPAGRTRGRLPLPPRMSYAAASRPGVRRAAPCRPKQRGWRCTRTPQYGHLEPLALLLAQRQRRGRRGQHGDSHEMLLRCTA